MATILLVEDEADLRDLVSYNLRAAGYEVIEAATGKDALTFALKSKPDLLLLDLMLPDISGTEVCRRVRAEKALANAKIVMLTARGEEIDRVVGFELGADDYVVKPFSVRELVLRVNAVLRRTPSPSESSDEPLAVGRLTLDKGRHKATVDGHETNLTALEFKLLTTLIERRGRVQSRERLLSDVWEASPDMTTRTVDTHIKRLREKLGPAGDYVETVRGVGYRFVESTECEPLHS